jgi:predicted DNA-binding antitoxin AbrB/MazE fold protein
LLLRSRFEVKGFDGEEIPMNDFPNMSALRAIYEHGVFRPLETVNLPECTEVLVEPRLAAAPLSQTGRERIYQILAQRFDSGENDVAARHDEHQP